MLHLDMIYSETHSSIYSVTLSCLKQCSFGIEITKSAELMFLPCAGSEQLCLMVSWRSDKVHLSSL